MNKHNRELIEQQRLNINPSNTLTKIECEGDDTENVPELEFFNITSRRGSIELYDVLVCYPSLSITDKIVYCTLKDYANYSSTKNFTSASMNDVANRLNISKATVSRSIAKLQKMGIVSLYKNAKNQRFIKIERNFEEEQEEEKQYWSSHEKEFEIFTRLSNLKKQKKAEEFEEDYDFE